MAFKLVPSDPEFPFDMPFLDCVLHVPLSCPGTSKPTLQVRNEGMGRGYQINIEKGFNVLAQRSQRLTLLDLMKALDRQLETLLSAQKADTIKIIANARKPAERESTQFSETPEPLSTAIYPQPAPVRSVEPAHSAERRAEASARRDAETRQLEARLGRLPLFQKSTDGIAFTLPIDPRRRDELPVSLQSIKTLRLFVPMLYPLLPCRISLQGVARDAAITTEKAFERRAKEAPGVSLIAQINYLATNMHVFATQEVGEETSEKHHGIDFGSLDIQDDGVEDQKAGQSKGLGSEEEERSHIHLIPRPPEWNIGAEDDSDQESSDSEDFSDHEAADEEASPHADGGPSSGPERGVAISFPQLEMYGIELLELTSLSLAVKCGRCKDVLDVGNLRHTEGSGGGLRTESCKKCASVLSLGEFLLKGELGGNDALLIWAGG